MERLVLPVLNGNGQMSTVPAHVTVTGGCEVALNEADRLADVMRDGFQRFDIGLVQEEGAPPPDGHFSKRLIDRLQLLSCN